MQTAEGKLYSHSFAGVALRSSVDCGRLLCSESSDGTVMAQL